MKFIEPDMRPLRRLIVEEHRRRPSAAAFMARTLLPSPGVHAGTAFPRIIERWNRIRIDRDHLRSFLDITGLPSGGGIAKLGPGPGTAASLLYPHVFGFPLIMALVTHRAFPLPVWRALQIRNHFLLCRPYTEHEPLDLAVRVAGHRILAKGVEVDLHAELSSRGDIVWEGLTTFYFRGSYGPGQEPSVLARPQSGEWPERSRWTMPPLGRWRSASLTGDYNGIHWWNWWARRMGFKAALYQSQYAVGHCLARLEGSANGRERLDVWLKGPVYHHAGVRLSATAGPEQRWFALSMDGVKLPSIIGRWGSAPAGCRLMGEDDVPLPLEGRA